MGDVRFTSALLQRPLRPRADSTIFLLCDVQERFRDLIFEFASVVQVAGTLARVGEALHCPVIVTEQYPRALGKTVPELQSLLKSAANPGGAPTFPKLKFSMLTPEVRECIAAARPDATDYVLCGIEAHVCVQQTALELLEAGARVHVVVDGVSSQRKGDRNVALRLLELAGAQLTTTESIVFSLLGSAEHPAFKAVQRIIVDHNRAGPSRLSQE